MPIWPVVDWAELNLFFVILARMSGFVLFNPILGRQGIPNLAKSGLIMVQRKERVCSWICVTAWKMARSTPTSILKSSMGPQTLMATQMPSRPTINAIKESAYDPYKEGRITQEEFFERAQEPLKEFMLNQTEIQQQLPSVQQDKEQDLERCGDHGGRQHHHAHGHQCGGHNNVQQQKRDIEIEAYLKVHYGAHGRVCAVYALLRAR